MKTLPTTELFAFPSQPRLFAKFGLAAAILTIAATTASAQLSYDGSTAATVTFDATLTGVSNGSYAGAGRSGSPISGQLDSDFWAAFGQGFDGGNGGGNYAKGLVPNETTFPAGFAAITDGTVATGSSSFGFQPVNDNSAAFDFRILTSAAVTSFSISFDAFYNKEDLARTTGLEFSYAIDAGGDAITDAEVDALTFTSISGLNIAPSTAAAAGVWNPLGNLSSDITASAASGDAIILRFTYADIEGAGGSRTLIGLDNLTIATTAVPEPSTFALIIGAGAFVLLRRRRQAAASRE